MPQHKKPVGSVREIVQPNGPKIQLIENQPPCKILAEGGKFFVPPSDILPKLKPLVVEDRRAYQIRMMRMCEDR
jgi:hypothetical protein